jgi:ribosomal protein S18 acetylase RimI-like enzyme
VDAAVTEAWLVRIARMNALEIRLATAEDAERLLPMMADFNALEGIEWSRENVRPALERLLRSPELGLAGLVHRAGETLGYFLLTWGFDLEWAGRDAFLTELYLLPEARANRAGSDALPLIEALAREHGARALHLMVRPENEPAVRLYARAGYRSPPRVFLSRAL